MANRHRVGQKIQKATATIWPFMISHPKFKPSFKILSHSDEPQIPWGVVRIEFRNENAVFGAILPRGRDSAAPRLKAGYRSAQQNCFRWLIMGHYGGMYAGVHLKVHSPQPSDSPTTVD